MSHSYDVNGNLGGTGPGQPSVNTLAQAPNGDVHLLVTFEILADNPRTDGGEGDVSAATVTVPGADDREFADDRGSTDDLGGVADGDPFVDSVICAGASSAEHIDPEFDEAVDVESLVSYLGLDFVEHEMFAEQFLPDSDDVVYTSRGIGGYQLLCVYSADQGLLLVVDEDEAIQPLVGHARSLLTET